MSAWSVKALQAVDKLPYLLLIPLAIFAALAPNAGYIDGKLFPVVTGRIGHVTESYVDDGTVVQLLLHKHRNCRFETFRVEWVDDDGVMTRIPWNHSGHKLEPPAKVKQVPKGEHSRYVILHTDVPRDRWIITMLHKCYPFVLTSTKVYP